jgi:hypothetical protein
MNKNLSHQPENLGKGMRRRLYLLTCWQEPDGVIGRANWRFQIETPGTAKHRLYIDLQDVMTAIERELQVESSRD